MPLRINKGKNFRKKNHLTTKRETKEKTQKIRHNMLKDRERKEYQNANVIAKGLGENLLL